MKIYEGKSVFGGIVIGRINVYKKDKQKEKRMIVSDTDAQLARYEQAKDAALSQLQELYDKALRQVGKKDAEIFQVHQMLLKDKEYNDSVKKIVCDQSVNAEYAVALTGDYFAQMFKAMDNDYMRERSADIQDISERLLAVLNGAKSGAVSQTSDEPVIVVADDLAPSEAVLLDKDKVLALITVRGSVNSHTAILAKTMGIPMLAGTNILPDDRIDQKLGILDSTEGKFYVEPEEEVLIRMQKKQSEEAKKKERLFELKGKENVTIDGKKIILNANIGNIRDLDAVLQNDADGIGLFRSEFIYLEKENFPTEEEQFQIYKKAAEVMTGKPVVIRTLDIGADKQCDYFPLEPEENPALGCRAIRICLTHPEIFKTQLRAIFRASAFGKIAVMYPMITSVKEVRRIQTVVQEVKTELTEKNIAYGEPRQGIMIETPAAALISDELAKEVDFFSIGTNDLAQYTMAIDRRNPKLDEFYEAHHPAILRMISMVVENAHKAGIPVSICGELGADVSLTQEFLAMGVDELSVSPKSILIIREIVRETNVDEYKKSKKY